MKGNTMAYRHRPWLLVRPGETWIGPVGIFYRRIYGIELPRGTFIGIFR